MNSGSEALEEGLQSILEPYLWEAVSGEEANVNWEEALYSSLMGFIAGGLFEGVDMAIDTAAKVTNRIITKADIGDMDALINPIHTGQGTVLCLDKAQGYGILEQGDEICLEKHDRRQKVVFIM